jgi:hypothetical protein
VTPSVDQPKREAVLAKSLAHMGQTFCMRRRRLDKAAPAMCSCTHEEQGGAGGAGRDSDGADASDGKVVYATARLTQCALWQSEVCSQ